MKDELIFYSYNNYKKDPLKFNIYDLHNIPKITHPCYILVRNNNWNDFGYYTKFELIYFQDKKTINKIGGVKIIQRYKKNKKFSIDLNEYKEKDKTTLPNKFSSLDTNIYFSRGDKDLYQNLNKKNLEIRSKVLHALNDINIKAYMECDLNDDFDEEELISQFRKSLFRDESSYLESPEEPYYNAMKMLNNLNEFSNSLSRTNAQYQFLIYMAYGSTISSLETFLGDTFKSKVIQNPNYLLAFARFHIYSGKKNENEKSIRYDLAQLNLHADKIREFIIEETKEILNKINFQDVEKIYRLYNNILHIKLPNKLACFRENINNRHIIFHRNGKHIDGSDLNITILELLNLIKDVKEFIFSVNSSLKDLL